MDLDIDKMANDNFSVSLHFIYDVSLMKKIKKNIDADLESEEESTACLWMKREEENSFPSIGTLRERSCGSDTTNFSLDRAFF